MKGTLHDDDVVRRVLRGDHASFEILMRRHNRRVYRAVRSIVGKDAVAEDVMQDAYLIAFKNLERYSGPDAFAAWLTRIAVREALRVRKLESRWFLQDTLQDDDHPDGAAPPSENSSESDVSLGAILESSIDELPPPLRAVFVLRQVEDLSVAETAVSLDLSEANVKTRFHRARRALRDALERRLGDELEHVYGYAGARCDAMVARVMREVAGFVN